MRLAILIIFLLPATLASQTIEVFLIESEEVETQRAKSRSITDLKGRTVSTTDGWRAGVASEAVPVLIRSGTHAGKYAINEDFGLDAQNPSEDTKRFRDEVLMKTILLLIRQFPTVTVSRRDIVRDATLWQTGIR